jgi:hypothetical protein
MNGTIIFRTSAQLAEFLAEMEYNGVKTKFNVEYSDYEGKYILTFEKKH